MKPMKAFLVMMLALPAQAAAQNAALDTTSQFVPLTAHGTLPVAARTRISVDFRNESLESVLRAITRRAGLGLTYRPELPLNPRVTLKADSATAGSVLLRALEGTRIEALMKPGGSTVLLRAAQVTVPAAMPREDGEAPVAAIPLAEVVVTPGQFGVAHESPSKSQALSRERIETLPQLGEDIYRTVNRLPGVATNELSAKLTVRGGTDESLLVLLDGIELHEPYHLKDFDGSLSIIDVAAIGGVDFTTGGFTSEYGDRLTGVFDMRTSNRMSARPRTSIGLSLSNARFMSEGAFANGNGLWLVSARRGYLDILLELIGEDSRLDPRYYDALGKVVLQLSPKHRVSLHALRAGDSNRFIDDDDVGQIDSDYGSTYGWVAWDATLSDALRVSTKLYASRLDWKRFAAEHDECCNDYDVADVRSFDARGIKQDWQFGTERLVLKWGGELRTGSADYDYYRRQGTTVLENGAFVQRVDSLDVAFSPDGNSAGAYIAQRMRPWSRLTLETGLRWDHQSNTSETQWSPRVNAAIALPAQMTLRAAWGRYAQPQQLFQIPVQDGEQFLHPAERAEQIVAGLEKQLAPGTSVRVEAYQRREWSLRPRYRNLGSAVEPVAEVEPDRVRIAPDSARAQGIEFFFQRNGARSSWSASYALARAYDVVDGKRMNRPLEQRHTIYTDYTYAPSDRWRLSAAWIYHSGWPITIADFRIEPLGNGGSVASRYFLEPYGSRLSAYHRLDLRATRRIPLRRGQLLVFLDVFNTYDRDNPQQYDYAVSFTSSGRLHVARSIEPLLPRLPSIGATWEF